MHWIIPFLHFTSLCSALAATSEQLTNSEKLSIKALSGPSKQHVCGGLLAQHIKEAIEATGELASTLSDASAWDTGRCGDLLGHSIVHIDAELAEGIVKALIGRAMRESTGVTDLKTAFKANLVESAKQVFSFLPEKTRDVSALMSLLRIRRGDYSTYCNMAEPSARDTKILSEGHATYQLSGQARAHTNINYLLPLFRFIVAMTQCNSPPGMSNYEKTMTVHEYKQKYGDEGDGEGHPPNRASVPVVRTGDSNSRVLGDGHIPKESSPREEPAAPVVVPETPKDDIIAEQGTLQAQTSRLTRVASNVLKTWGMMRTAGIDAIDAVATVAMLADYADLVQQICYHLDAMDSSSRRVDEMIEATLDSTYVYVLKDKPELQAAE